MTAGISSQYPAQITLSAVDKGNSLFPLTCHFLTLYFVCKFNEIEVDLSEVSSHKVMNNLSVPGTCFKPSVFYVEEMCFKE